MESPGMDSGPPGIVSGPSGYPGMVFYAMIGKKFPTSMEMNLLDLST